MLHIYGASSINEKITREPHIPLTLANKLERIILV